MARFLFSSTLAAFLCVLPAILPALAETYHDEYKGAREPAFEKIYVKQCDLCTFCDGTYYYDEAGEPHKVGTVLHDDQGMYVLLIKYQCPLCGLSWDDKTPDDEHGCPILKRRYHKYIWD